ncbi:MAG: hypothetical protein COA78_25895 [Blastopirellula sp.]|nr:MAG: hypothetical protein COA78_25895 [Blastopirellula sp.]
MSRVQLFVQLTIATVLVALGFAVGTMNTLLVPKAVEDPHAHDEHDEEEDDHDNIVGLTTAAYLNMGVQSEDLGKIGGDVYFETLRIPGEVIEKPGHSLFAVTAPVQGVISKVYVQPGQALNVGDLLFDLKVVDDNLITTQVQLLDVISRISINEQEIERLIPLVREGTVSGRRKIELTYENEKMNRELENHKQNLSVRGLSSKQIAQVSKGELIRKIEVFFMPQFNEETLSTVNGDDKSISGESNSPKRWAHSIAKLTGYPGLSVIRGQELCRLAYHKELFIQGEAFQRDLSTLYSLNNKQWNVEVEFGESRSPEILENLSLRYIDNHVDTDTQTYHFYIPLKNQWVHETPDEQLPKYRTWRYKPGERVHIIVPVKKWENKFIVPVDAVVRQGAEAYIFRRAEHDHLAPADDPHAGHAHAEEEAAAEDDPHAGHDHAEVTPDFEFEKIPVMILHEGQRFVVLGNRADAEKVGVILPEEHELHADDNIAINKAYDLNLALKRASSSGGGGAHQGHAH